MTFKEYRQKQSFLLPPSFEDFLGESHEAVILNELLSNIDVSELEQSYNNENGGRSAYHPHMLLLILVYGYMNSIFSSRQIAKQLKQNLAFMYLSGNSTPDFRTISRFRKEKGAHLEKIFVLVIEKAKELGFVKFGTCSIDGTKIYANASKSKNESRKMIKDRIQSLIKEAERIDELEDGILGDKEDEEDDDLKTKEGREKRRREILDKKEKEENKLNKIEKLGLEENAKINITDKDSKLMQMKRKDYANGYNVQNITENGFILAHHIGNGSADQNTLIPSMLKLKKYFPSPLNLLADKGYSSEDNYSFLEEMNIDAYIPVNKEPEDLSLYTYNKKEDAYLDNNGNIYHFKQHMKRRDKIKLRGRPKKEENGCNKKRRDLYKRTIYEYIDKKTNKKEYLCISPEWQRYAKEQKEKLNSKEGKQIYKQRMHDVEGVFGNIKKNLRFTAFNLRGFEGVNVEWTLISLAHNLKEMILA